MGPTHTVTVRLHTDDYKEFKRLADEAGNKLANVIRLYLNKGREAFGKPPLKPASYAGRPRKRRE